MRRMPARDGASLPASPCLMTPFPSKDHAASRSPRFLAYPPLPFRHLHTNDREGSARRRPMHLIMTYSVVPRRASPLTLAKLHLDSGNHGSRPRKLDWSDCCYISWKNDRTRRGNWNEYRTLRKQDPDRIG